MAIPEINIKEKKISERVIDLEQLLLDTKKELDQIRGTLIVNFSEYAREASPNKGACKSSDTTHKMMLDVFKYLTNKAK